MSGSATVGVKLKVMPKPINAAVRRCLSVLHVTIYRQNELEDDSKTTCLKKYTSNMSNYCILLF